MKVASMSLSYIINIRNSRQYNQTYVHQTETTENVKVDIPC